MNSTPKVTVLMPVFNGEKHLKEAIDSILSQSFFNFEFLIINDGSTDKSAAIIERYKDPRIKITINECNLGLISSLNKGLEIAKGEYIARMDCDDISLPDRLTSQVIFLDAHKEVGVCGTWARIIDDKGNDKGPKRTLTGDAVKNLCWRPTPFIHPTCMIRAELLKNNKYNPAYPHAEDYELWLRLSSLTGFYTIDKFLYLYRIHEGNVSKTHRTQQLLATYKAFSNFMGNDKISYEDFLSLIPAAASINPFRRAYLWFLASEKTGFKTKYFLLDNLIYIKLWIIGYKNLDII